MRLFFRSAVLGVLMTVAGAAWAFACGWYVAIFCGLLYNTFTGRRG